MSVLTPKVTLKLTIEFYLAVLTQTEILIYKYDLKNPVFPTFISKIKSTDTKERVRFTQFPKESLLACFFDYHFEVFAINEEEVKLRYKTNYGIEKDLKIYQVPKAHEQTINVFFTQERQDMNIFSLWCLEVQFLPMDLHVEPIHKIYDIKKSLRNGLRMNNYSK